MGTECERKFLLSDNSIIRGLKGRQIEQGYMAINDKVAIRIRINQDEAFITIKEASAGMSRLEFDYVVPVIEAREMMENFSMPPVIRKVRYEIMVGQHLWEIDQFYDENEGLLLAEIELQHEEEYFELPPWIGDEVTKNKKYYNSELVISPFKSWQK